jgi:hypothetical protein
MGRIVTHVCQLWTLLKYLARRKVNREDSKHYFSIFSTSLQRLRTVLLTNLLLVVRIGEMSASLATTILSRALTTTTHRRSAWVRFGKWVLIGVLVGVAILALMLIWYVLDNVSQSPTWDSKHSPSWSALIDSTVAVLSFAEPKSLKPLNVIETLKQVPIKPKRCINNLLIMPQRNRHQPEWNQHIMETSLLTTLLLGVSVHTPTTIPRVRRPEILQILLSCTTVMVTLDTPDSNKDTERWYHVANKQLNQSMPHYAILPTFSFILWVGNSIRLTTDSDFLLSKLNELHV